MDLCKSARSQRATSTENFGPARASALVLGILLLAGAASALGQQSSAASNEQGSIDATTESNVIVALDSAPSLKDQQIAAATVDGDVTLSEMVKDPASRQLAERVASRVNGVRSVSNDLTVASAETGQTAGQGVAQVESAARQPSAHQASEYPSSANPTFSSQDADQVNEAQMRAPQMDASPPTEDGQTVPNTPQQTPQAGAQNNPAYPYPSGPAPRADDQDRNGASVDGNGYPQGAPRNQSPDQYHDQTQGNQAPPPRQPYDQKQYGQRGYDQRPYDQRGYNGQGPGYGDSQSRRDDNRNPAPENYAPLTLPASTMLRVRTNEFLDTRNLQPGSVFDVTAATDIFVGGNLAVPRGAVFQGVVTDVQENTSGTLKGSSSLTLKLTALELGGHSYPLDTELWTGRGPGKGAFSANNTIGGAAVGAVIGAIIGRGPGAAIGAVAGGATGAAASSATSGPQMVLAPETILTFHLAEPITITPVSRREAERLGVNQPPGRPYLRPRGHYPPPPPPYYGPGYYGPNYAPSFYYQYGRPW